MGRTEPQHSSSLASFCLFMNYYEHTEAGLLLIFKQLTLLQATNMILRVLFQVRTAILPIQSQ